MGTAWKSETEWIGKIFGRLTVLRFGGRTESRRYWICRCACGNEKRMREDGLKAGARSCGCERVEIVRARGVQNARHGHNRKNKRSPTYVTWVKMRRRCLVPADEHYPLYGGRGISICDEWMTFEGFLADMGERPAKHSLERIDNDGNYEPGNCRWATQKEQCNNTRVNIFIEFEGKRMTVTQWEERLNFPRCMVQQRLRDGWTVERALTTPPQNRSLVMQTD